MGRKTVVEYRVYDGSDALARAAAEHFLETAQAAIRARGRARIAISGGNTPKRTFELLANPQEPFLKTMRRSNSIGWMSAAFPRIILTAITA